MAVCVTRGRRGSTPELLVELEALVPLAPLDEPHNLAPIKMALKLNPDLSQVACFYAAFHRTAPEVEQAFAHHWHRRSAASMASCSPPASARTPHRCAPPSAAPVPG